MVRCVPPDGPPRLPTSGHGRGTRPAAGRRSARFPLGPRAAHAAGGRRAATAGPPTADPPTEDSMTVGSLPTRDQGLSLLHEWISNPNLRKHCYAVEAAMRAYARRLGGD